MNPAQLQQFHRDEERLIQTYSEPELAMIFDELPDEYNQNHCLREIVLTLKALNNYDDIDDDRLIQLKNTIRNCLISIQADDGQSIPFNIHGSIVLLKFGSDYVKFYHRLFRINDYMSRMIGLNQDDLWSDKDSLPSQAELDDQEPDSDEDEEDEEESQFQYGSPAPGSSPLSLTMICPAAK